MSTVHHTSLNGCCKCCSCIGELTQVGRGSAFASVYWHWTINSGFSDFARIFTLPFEGKYGAVFFKIYESEGWYWQFIASLFKPGSETDWKLSPIYTPPQHNKQTSMSKKQKKSGCFCCCFRSVDSDEEAYFSYVSGKNLTEEKNKKTKPTYIAVARREIEETINTPSTPQQAKWKQTKWK